eukprot:9499046-Karenia_brevis.AAC.1
MKTWEYKLPTSRERVLLRGLHKKFCPTGLPPVLPPFGTAVLADILGKKIPNKTSGYTAQQTRNHKWYAKQTAMLSKKGSLKPTDVVCFAMDRAPNKEFRPIMAVNKAPTITTSNKYLT